MALLSCTRGFQKQIEKEMLNTSLLKSTSQLATANSNSVVPCLVMEQGGSGWTQMVVSLEESLRKGVFIEEVDRYSNTVSNNEAAQGQSSRSAVSRSESREEGKGAVPFMQRV